MRKIEPEFITGMGYIGASPGVLYHMGGAGEQTVVTGNPALLEGVKGNRITSLTLHGKSTQGSTPSPSYPQEIENAGQSGEIGVQVYGGNLFDIRKASPWEDAYGLQMSLDGEYITVKGVTTTTRYGNISFRILGYPVNLYGNRFSLDIVKNVGTSKEYVYTSATENALALSVVVDAKAAVELKFRLMVNAGSTALPYEPYKPAQKLIIPTPGGLPGIPVSSGGNYTDKDGQQWVCDEVDFKKGVYVQRIGKRTITSKDVFHKSGMSTDDVNYFSLGNFSLHIGTIGEKDVLMSNCFVAGINHGFSAWGKIFLSSAFDGKVYFSVEAQKYPDEETFKQWAVENGLMFLYQLVDIIETPLAAEELSAYKTLRTYSPTTTVINDAEAGMSVGYKRRK